MTRLDVLKTYKLFIDGKFARSESGRTLPVCAPTGALLAYASRASRKDLRDAVEAARKAQPGWAGASAYNRGQVLYRLAEMMQGKRAELAEAIDAPVGETPGNGRRGRRAKPAGGAEEVTAAIERVVHYAGWADKYAQVLGCNNPVASGHYNFTVPEPTGVVVVLTPDQPALLSLVTLMAPVLCSGNSVVAIASAVRPLPAVVLSEAIATSDVPPGVVNILTGERGELAPFAARHRDVNAIHAAGLTPEEAAQVRAGVAENLKRVRIAEPAPDWFDVPACENPWWIEPFVEFKTMWHPGSA